MKLIGQILLWAGFLSGSLATIFHLPAAGVESVKKLTQATIDEKKMRFTLPDVSDVEVPVDGWHLIPWTWYLCSVGVAIAGIVILYKQRGDSGQKSEETRSNLKEIKGSLDSVIVSLAKLMGELEKKAPTEITAYIDAVLADDLRAFAEGRDSITAEHDLTLFAEVMTQFAAGERSINRAWSAAADGYVDEVETCLKRADACLKQAKNLLAEA